MTKPGRPAIFVDRDGTLIEEREYLSRPEDVRLLPGAATAIDDLRLAGFACVMITNQSGLGRGWFTEGNLDQVHQELIRQLALAGSHLDGIYVCPHAPTSADTGIIEHPDRKPGPGLLFKAARELSLDLSASWMIGDKLSDVLAGRNAGCRGNLLVRSGHPLPAEAAQDWLICDDLAAAARHILCDGAASSGG